MYHVTVGGHLITNLRLSGETLMKIFTGQITNWDDPEITKDYGAQLPNEPIIPVVRSDGSGATYFFTRWMAHEFPAEWNAFCQKAHPGIKLPCPQTEFYPQFGNAKLESGSNAVSVYVTSSYGEGAIGYDEYAYALNAHWPVVAMENPAGYYVLPTASNVAVALTQAQINEDQSSPNFLQQNLDNVYTYTDPRSYPLSSYSYLIVPKTGSQRAADLQQQRRPIAVHLYRLLPLPGTAAGGGARLLAAADQPRHGRVPAGQQDSRDHRGARTSTTTAAATTRRSSTARTSCCRPPRTRPSARRSARRSTARPQHGRRRRRARPRPSPARPPPPRRRGDTAPRQDRAPGRARAPGRDGTGNRVRRHRQRDDGAEYGHHRSVVTVPGNGADGILLAVITALGVAVAVAAPPSVAAYLRRRRAR